MDIWIGLQKNNINIFEAWVYKVHCHHAHDTYPILISPSSSGMTENELTLEYILL